MKHIKPQLDKTAKDLQTEKPKKAPRIAAKREREEAESEDGQPVVAKKAKKHAGIVAIKHKQVLQNLGKKNLGKSRKTTVQKAMTEAGYSPSYARAGQIGKTKSWDKLVEEYLPDELIAETHHGLMVAKKLDYMLFVHDIKDEDIYELMESVNCVPKKIIHGIQGTHVWFWATDNKARKDALDMSFKIKGKYTAEKIEVQGGFAKMSDADLADLIRKQKSRFLKKD